MADVVGDCWLPSWAAREEGGGTTSRVGYSLKRGRQLRGGGEKWQQEHARELGSERGRALGVVVTFYRVQGGGHGGVAADKGGNSCH
jgi:hypothetical protein